MTKFNICDLDITKLTNELCRCKGAVIMRTEEGDVFNLRSTLSRIIGIMNIIHGGIAGGATVECENEEDEKRFFEMIIYNNNKKSA